MEIFILIIFIFIFFKIRYLNIFFVKKNNKPNVSLLVHVVPWCLNITIVAKVQFSPPSMLVFRFKKSLYTMFSQGL